MTKDERIKGHFSAIAECAGNLRRNFDPERVIENDEVAQYLRKQLDDIEELLKEDEPECLASSVMRLTDLCNALEKENCRLKKELDQVKLSLASRNRLVTKTRDYLTSVAAEENKRLKQDLTTAELQLDIAQRRIERFEKSANQPYIEDLRATLKEFRAENERLKREFALQERYIKFLKEDRRHRK